MLKRKLFGVQKEPVELLHGLADLRVCDSVVAAFVVGGVSDDRMIDRGEMDSDLMRAAGFDVDLEQRELLKTLSYFPKRQRVSPVRRDGHLCPVPSVAGDRPVDRAGVLSRASVDKRNVGFLDGATPELFRKRLVCLLVLGYKNEAGGILVEPMYDPHAAIGASAT